jgi:tricorn protease
MNKESRGMALLLGLGALLVVASLVLPRWVRGGEESPVDRLPTVAAPPAIAAPRPLGSAAPAATTAAAPARLMRHPTLSRTQIAFDFAGEIWVVAREGREARRLVTGQLGNQRPIFSPDGSTLAFTGGYDRNDDVYVVPAAGGEARRLTYYSGHDEAVGWTPDGTRVVFASMRATPRDLPKLFTMPVTGGFPDELPVPSGASASLSPDGKRLAYVPFASTSCRTATGPPRSSATT